MLLVAVTMVWHTLRYRSQVVTGLAYLLAFLTVGLNHDHVAFVNSLVRRNFAGRWTGSHCLALPVV